MQKCVKSFCKKQHSVEINFALDLSFYKMKDIKEIFEEKNSINIRFSNMFKHNYVFYPLINYTTLLFDKSFSFINRNMPIKKFEILEKSEKRILEFSPRFIKLYEINLLYMNYLMNNNDFLLDNEKNIEKTKKLYFKMNYEGKYEIDRQEMYNKMFTCEVKDFVKNLNYNEICINYNKKMKEIYFSFEEDDWLWFLDDDDEKEKIKSKLEKEEKKLKVAVANMKVKYSDAILSLTEPNISKERLEDLFKILNMAKEEKADMLIFPEMAIPFCWLSFISKFAEENDIAIICGLEYFVDHNKTAYNTLATILPFKIDIYDSALIKLRIKNHYAPQEKLELISKGFKVPLINSYTYDLFKWKNISFACYNCFELTDIVHRSIFKSKIDLIVAAVYNHDTNYFSNIVESTARDLHCYFVLVNSSDLGDTRITMPTKTEEKNLLKIKGGINSVVLTEELSIKELREFQLLEFKEQKKYIKKDISIKEIEKILNEDEDDDALKKLEKIKERIDKYKKNKENKSFKPTPPKFDTDEIKNRG